MVRKLTLKLLIYTLPLLVLMPAAARNTESTIEMFHPAGPAKMLTKQEAVLLALRNNPQIKSAYLQRVVDKFALEVARNEFEVKYSLSGLAEYTAEGDLAVRGGPGATLKLPIGTEVSVQTNTSVLGTQTGEATFNLKQPLLRGFGTDVNLVNLRNAKDTECINRLNFKEQFQNTITQVISAYHQLVQDYNTLAVDKASLKDSLDSLKAARLQIKAGNRAETSITQTEAQVARQRYTITSNENTIKQDTQKLLILLGMNPHAKISVDQIIDISNVKVPSEKESIRLALKNNIAYRTNLLTFKTLERNLLLARDAQRWDLSLNATSKELLVIQDDPTFNGRRAWLDLTIPIDDKTRQQQLVTAKVNLDKYKIEMAKNEQQLISDVITALSDIKAQQEQIHLAEQTVKYSEQSLRISQKKLQFGRSTEFETTSLLTQLTSEQQTLINQKITYLNTVAKFEETLGVSLDRWHVQLNYC